MLRGRGAGVAAMTAAKPRRKRQAGYEYDGERAAADIEDHPLALLARLSALASILADL